MSVDFLSHEVEKEFAIEIFQKRKDLLRFYVPSRGVDECEGKAVAAGSGDLVDVVLERPLEDLNIELLSFGSKSPARPIFVNCCRTVSSVTSACEKEASEKSSLSDTRQGPANASTKLKTGVPRLGWRSLKAAASRYLLRKICLM